MNKSTKNLLLIIVIVLIVIAIIQTINHDVESCEKIFGGTCRPYPCLQDELPKVGGTTGCPGKMLCCVKKLQQTITDTEIDMPSGTVGDGGG